MSSQCLKTRQRETVVEIIKSAVALNTRGGTLGGWQEDSSENGGNNDWKLLIYDSVGRDVIAPLLKVKELRDLGVTLHMTLDKPRQPVPGVPAIYLCEPTEENIIRIAKDASDELYQSFHINFISQIPRRLLEVLAEHMTGLPSVNHIRCVDRNLRYIAEANDFFHLMQHDSFYTLNSSKTSDAMMEAMLNKTVLGITHVIQSQQILPVVAYSRGGAAQELGSRLSSAISDLIREQLIPPNVGSTGRPVLLISERSADLVAGLHHCFTYRGLLIDELGFRLNKAEVKGEDGKEKVFELDPEADSFFQQTASLDFGEVGNKVHELQLEYNQERNEFSANDGSDSIEVGGESSVSRMLANAPRLAEKKRSLDAHTSLAFAILAKIKARSLDVLHGVEDGVIGRSRPDMPQIAELLKGNAASIVDKQRLFLVLLLTQPEEETANLESEFLQYVQTETEPFGALSFIKQLRQWSRGGAAGAEENRGGNALAGGWRNFTEGIAKSLKTSSSAKLALTRLVDALLQDTPSRDRSKILDGVEAIDPRTKQPVDVQNVRFSQCLVFSLGGGCPAELDDLKEWEKNQQFKKSVTYGSTEMLSGAAFLQQLTALGTESS